MKQNSQTKNKKPTFSHDSFFKHFYSDPSMKKPYIAILRVSAEQKTL